MVTLPTESAATRRAKLMDLLTALEALLRTERTPPENHASTGQELPPWVMPYCPQV